MVGSALVRRLRKEGCILLTIDRTKLDLKQQEAVERWVSDARAQAIFVSAAKVGGIQRTKPATYLYDNIYIAANMKHAAAANGIEKLLYLACECI